jgi:hypothetical protein
VASYSFIGGNDEEINRISSNRVGYRRVVGVNKDDLFKRGQKQDKCLDGIPAIDSVQQFILIRHN